MPLRHSQEPAIPHHQQHEAVNKRIAVGQVGREMHAVNHEVERCDARAKKHENQKSRHEDFPPAGNPPVRPVKWHQHHREHAGINIRKVLISCEHRRASPEEMIRQ